MSIAKKIAFNTGIQLAGKTLSTLLGLGAVAMMTRQLGVEQFGWYVTASGFLQFIGIITDFGFTVTTANLAAEYPERARRLVNTLFSWRLVSALLIHGSAPFIILLFPYPPAVKTAVAIMAVSFLATALNQVLIGYNQARLQAKVYTYGEVLSRIVLVVGIALGGLAQTGFLYVIGVITTASLIYTVYLLTTYGRISLSFDRELTALIFPRLWPTALAIICNTIYLQGDRFFLPLHVSQSEVGLYGASYRVLDIVLQMAAMIMGVLMPLIASARSRNDEASFTKYIELSFELIALILLPAAVAMAVLSAPLMRFVAGDEFASAGAMLRLLSPAVIGVMLGMTAGHIVLALNAQRQALVIYFSDAVLSLVGYMVLIPRYGVNGAIIVTIFSELYAGGLLALLAVRRARFFPRFGNIAKIIGSSLIMGGILYLGRSWPFPLLVGLGFLSYALLIIVGGVIPVAAIREIFSKQQIKQPIA